MSVMDKSTGNPDKPGRHAARQLMSEKFLHDLMGGPRRG